MSAVQFVMILGLLYNQLLSLAYNPLRFIAKNTPNYNFFGAVPTNFNMY